MIKTFKPSITRLLVEVGETNMRCALLSSDHDAVDSLLHPRMIRLEDHETLTHALSFYCHEINLDRTSPLGLLMAIAPQPKDGVYTFKHRPDWHFHPRDLLAALDLIEVDILNDLESHAYAVLAGARGVPLFEGVARPDEGPIAVIAPGTGLGFAYVTPSRNTVQQSFGGHMRFNGLGVDDPHFNTISGQLLFPQTTFEDIVSGPGLKQLRDILGASVADDYFARVFGLFIHNAVMFGHAMGGVVITGGLIPALLAEGRLDWALVRAAYGIDNIAAVSHALQNVPWSLIDDPYLGLRGLAAWAALNNEGIAVHA